MEEKNVDIKSMFDTNELNRLQRCAKNKDKKEIQKWGQDLEQRINEYYYNYYRKQFAEWVEKAAGDIAFD